MSPLGPLARKWFPEYRLLVGLFAITGFIVQSALAHTLHALLQQAKDDLHDALKFLNVHVSFVHLKLGDKIANGVDLIADPIISALGNAAQAADAQIAKWFYGMERTVKEIYDAIEATAMITVSLAYWAGKEIYHGAIGGKINVIQTVQRAQAKAQADTRARANAATRAVGHPLDRRIAHQVGARTAPLQAEINALHRATAVTLPGEISWLRDRTGQLEHGYEAVRTRIRELGKATVGITGAAITAVALERLGVSWIRCSRWKRLGKGICGPWGNGLDGLISLIVAEEAIRDLPGLVRELQLVTRETVEGIQRIAQV